MIRPKHSPRQQQLARRMRISLLDPRVKTNLEVSGSNFRRLTRVAPSAGSAEEMQIYPTLFHLLFDLQQRPGSGSGIAVCGENRYEYTFADGTYTVQNRS